jgi:CheY-like chemotaxis protein
MPKILMIDDDADFTFSVQVMLEARGYRFAWAKNGAEGLERVKSERPDLIILDVMMGSFTEGFHVARSLRDASPDAPYAAYRHIPILMLTSIHQATTLRFAPDEDYLPVEVFLDKSASPEQLLARVEELAGKA